MKFSYLLFSSAVLLTAVVACDENNIGTSVLDSNSFLIVDSAFTITGESVENPKIQSRTTSQLLGMLQAPEYGILSSDIVTEFMPSSSMDTVGVSVEDIDSLKLRFVVPMGSYSGDSITPMRVSVYKLNRNLPNPIYSDFEPADYYSKTDLLGSTSYTMTMLGQNDTLFTYDSNYSKIYYRMVEVKLPQSLGKELYSQYLRTPDIYKDPEQFAKFFPGIYATTTYGNGRVINITQTTMNLYYHKHSKTEEGNDTILVRTGQYFGVSPEVTTNNNIRLQTSSILQDMITNGDVIVQAPAGYNAMVKLPVKSIIEKFDTFSEEGLTVLNDVTISIPVSEIENGYHISVPTYLLLIKASEKDKFFESSKLIDNTTSFYATYNKSTKRYTFSGLREYIKYVQQNRSEITDEDEEFLLMPVDISFESTNSSYYSSAEQQVSAIAPQVSTPAMAKLDLRNTKIMTTYSKKDYSK